MRSRSSTSPAALKRPSPSPRGSKGAAEVAEALSRIYKRSPLKWPKLLQVDPGKEFMGAVSQLMAKHGVSVRRGRVDNHRDQGIVERFNRTLAEKLFGHQYAQEMLLAAQAPATAQAQRSSEWVTRLPDVVAALNGEVTRLIGKRPSEAIHRKAVSARPAAPARRPVGFKSRSSPQGSAFVICTSLVSWRAVAPGPPTPRGL